MGAALDVHGLRKSYDGVDVLAGIDLTVPEGSIFGFLGPNGAGKTTTLRIITGLARASGGTVRVLNGSEGTGPDTRAQIGFLPDVPAFYEWMRAEEFMRLCAGLFGLDARVAADRSAMLLETAGLTGVRTPIGDYSRGMKQRLGIAQALINAPRLLLLDEPTSALDPIGRRDVLDLIASLRGRTTVFFSTHILADVERVCDTVAILHRGRVLSQGPIADLTSRSGHQRLILDVVRRPRQVAAALAAHPWVAEPPSVGGLRIEVAVTNLDEARLAIPGIVAEAGAGLARLDAGERTLEDIFVELIGADS